MTEISDDLSVEKSISFLKNIFREQVLWLENHRNKFLDNSIYLENYLELQKLLKKMFLIKSH
jgi:hypothetical protein